MDSFLKTIKSPKDIKKLEIDELNILAKEIRREIIKVVSENGGHLSSNLGVVELTLALHYVFNSPEDIILWDVGHQCYTHKLITGRYEKFHTLRQYQGLSGFPKKSESPHDHFDVGHSGTSLSTAFGLALARDNLKKDFYILVVIGDGSMTSGLALEGLNQIGDKKNDKLIVILNDNKMSISPNVGALAQYFSRRLITPTQTRIREALKYNLERIPKVGKILVKLIQKFEESFKLFLVPGVLFEELGFRYVGPIDGHNIPVLIETLEHTKHLKGPVLVHVLTKKGKGYRPAEKNSTIFHGAAPFNVESGEFRRKSKNDSYSKVFGNTLTKFAQQDKRIFAITAAMEEGTGLVIFKEKFPDRFIDVGIAEQTAITTAGGLAYLGLKPVVAIYSTFLQRGYDQLIHDVCLQNLPVVFAIDRSGIVGSDGETHQGLYDLSFLRCVPNLIIMSPKDEKELVNMLYTALNIDKPVAIRYPRGAGPGSNWKTEPEKLEVGKAEIYSIGEDINLISIGHIFPTVKKVYDKLLKDGFNVGLINARFIKPIDKNMLKEVAKRKALIVTIEENVLNGGFGSACLETLNDMGISNIRLLRIGLPLIFMEHGSQSILRDKYGLSEEKIYKRIIKFLDSSNNLHSKALIFHSNNEKRKT